MRREARPELSGPALLAYASTSVAMLGTSALSPVLPSMQTALSVSDASIGLVMSVFTFAVAVSVPVLGWLADRVGRRPVLGGSLLVLGVSGVATFLAPDFLTVLVLRAVQGVGFAGVIPMVVTVVSDMFEGADAVGAQGLRVTAVNLGGFVFPVLTGALVVLAWNVPFLLFATCIPVGVAVLWKLPEPADVSDRPEGSYVRAVLAAARRPLVAVAIGVGTMRFFSLYVLYAYLPLLAVDRGLSAGQIGLLVGAISFLKMLVATQARTSLVLGPPRIVSPVALLLTMVAGGGFALADSFAGFLVVAVVVGVLEGANAPLQKIVLTEYVTSNVRAGVVSVNAASQNLGKTAGPILAGVALTTIGLPPVFLALAGLGVVVSVVLVGIVVLVGEPADPATV